MEIKERTLKEKSLDIYRWKFLTLERKRFVDFTHDVTGKMCAIYYHPETKRYELEPIEKNG